MEKNLSGLPAWVVLIIFVKCYLRAHPSFLLNSYRSRVPCSISSFEPQPLCMQLGRMDCCPLLPNCDANMTSCLMLLLSSLPGYNVVYVQNMNLNELSLPLHK